MGKAVVHTGSATTWLHNRYADEEMDGEERSAQVFLKW